MPKKLLLLVVAALGGLVAARRARSRQDEQDLWTEAAAVPDLR